jgi:HPt (histidine-containing phosphotransfer) domain-containing protein
MTQAGNNPNAINWAELAAKLGGEPDFIHELLRVVIATNAAAPGALRQAARTGEMAVIERLAHRTKGVAGDLVADTCHALAHETDLAARAREPRAAGLSLQLADALDALLDDARTHLVG